MEQPHFDLVLGFLVVALASSTGTSLGLASASTAGATSGAAVVSAADESDLTGSGSAATGADTCAASLMFDADLMLMIWLTSCSAFSFSCCTNSSASLASSPSGRNGLSVSLKSFVK